MRQKKHYFLFFLILQIHLFSQQRFGEHFITPGGTMDTVFDRFGHKYPIENLQIDSKLGSATLLMTANNTSCTAGMFAVYFANGSGMENFSNPTHIIRRQTVCEVLSNISGLLGYNASYPSSALVRILVDDVSNYTYPVSPASSGVLGLATAFYVVPCNPVNSNPGIAENIIQKTIKSRNDGWTNVVSPLVPLNANGLFHGVMAFNFSNPFVVWNSNIGALASASEFDLYTVILHEVTHALGFASLINGNGNSKFGVANNYYSLYDMFLNKKTSNILTPLLASLSGCTPQYDLIFTASTSNLAPGCTPSYSTDVTNCSTAIFYNSSFVPNMPVYTPDCFEPSSSLSHFEDMCYPTNNPANNNQYFTMSNGGGAGTNKRFLKQEERNVLCDLEYTVASTYTSNALSASTNYTGGNCIPSPVWGVNDGISGSAFSYTSAGGPIVIPITGGTGIISNDYQGSNPVTTVSCVESVYNNGSAVVSGTNIVFTPSNTNGGIFLIRYLPKNVIGQEGNITYIFGFVYPSFCGSVSPCDMVQNGGFENNSGCGYMPIGTSTISSCWLVGSLSPDLYVRNCTQGTLPANLGVNTCSSTTVFDSFSGPPNNAVMGLGAYTAGGVLFGSESLANYLGAPVQNGQAYTLSFWAYQFTGKKYDPGVTDGNGNYVLQSFNLDSISAVLSFATSFLYVPPSFSVSSYPDGQLLTISSVTLANVFNTWRHYSVTFTTSPMNNGNWLYIGADKNLTLSSIINKVGPSQSAIDGRLFYTLIDDVSLRPTTQAPQLKMPYYVCSGSSLLDLGQYVNVPGGSFSGPGVTSSVISVGGGTVTQYYFNAALSLPNGLYTITFSYTDNINCVQTAIHQIKVGNSATTPLAYASNTNCVNSGTLIVMSPLPSYNYTWQPGNLIGNTVVITPSINTTYTVTGSGTSTCLMTGSVNVTTNIPYAQILLNPPAICPGSTTQISAIGNYSTILWNPGNYTTSAINVSPVSPTLFTASLTNAYGCSATISTFVTLSSLPQLSISASSPTVCSGQNATLTVTGAFWYNWSSGSNSSVTVVYSQNTATYYVTGTGTNNCSSTSSVVINIFTPSIAVNGQTTICAGESVTLTAQSGANSYAWYPINLYSAVIVVTPPVSTTYTVFTNKMSAAGTCKGENSVYIKVDPCLGMKKNSSTQFPFKLYPNPNDGSFIVEATEGKDCDIQVFDETGQLIRHMILDERNDRKLLIQDIAAGFYVVRSSGAYTKLIISK